VTAKHKKRLGLSIVLTGGDTVAIPRHVAAGREDPGGSSRLLVLVEHIGRRKRCISKSDK
jgi:hypothetical protein